MRLSTISAVTGWIWTPIPALTEPLFMTRYGLVVGGRDRERNPDAPPDGGSSGIDARTSAAVMPEAGPPELPHDVHRRVAVG